MENEDENLHTIIMDAGIDFSLHSLHNPTEEFMINLVTEYLKRFHFDGDEIAKPTLEQLGRVSCEEAALNAIQAINLHAALSKICDEIFLKDFTLTDITNPGYKKIKKMIKVLFNFYLYVKNKKLEKQQLFFELESRQKEIQDLIDKKEEFTARTGSMIHEREMKLECKEKLKKEIEELKVAVANGKKKSESLQQKINKIKSEHQKSLGQVNDTKAKVHELHKINKELASKIVKSPEEVVGQKEDLENVIKEKMEERQIFHDSISSKKAQIEKNVSSECIIQECHTKAKDTMDVVKKLKEIRSKLIMTKKKLVELNEEIVLLERTPGNARSSNSSQDSDLASSQRLLSELHNSQAEKQREYEALKKKLEELQNENRNRKSLLQKEKQEIVEAERDSGKLLREYKTLFENEVAEEYTFRKDLDKFVKDGR